MPAVRFPVALVLLLNLVALAAPTTASAAEPNGFEYFHTYSEVKAEIDQTVAARNATWTTGSVGLDAFGG